MIALNKCLLELVRLLALIVNVLGVWIIPTFCVFQFYHVSMFLTLAIEVFLLLTCFVEIYSLNKVFHYNLLGNKIGLRNSF
jgi:hypothetical protein